MSEKSLWGELPTQDLIRTPYLILREQAALLGEMTENLLVGEVERTTEHYDRTFFLILKIVAPTLDNYSYSVLYAEHDVELYPVTVAPDKARLGSDDTKCKNEDEFVQAVSRILSSEQVKKVIRGLLSQVKS